MNKDISASQSKNSAISATGTTPFDEILHLEKQEKARVQKEIENMQVIEQDMEQTCSKKESEADQKLKDTAKEELKEFRKNELSKVLKEAESNAVKKCKKIEETYTATSDNLAKKLADNLIESDSLISA